jgi:hypothetical protein
VGFSSTNHHHHQKLLPTNWELLPAFFACAQVHPPTSSCLTKKLRSSVCVCVCCVVWRHCIYRDLTWVSAVVASRAERTARPTSLLSLSLSLSVCLSGGFF